MADSAKTFTIDECQKHSDDKSCWLVVHGKVYDVTDFLEEHPGGYDIIVTSAGKDATQDFEEIGHSKSARDMLEKYLIGSFAGGDSAPTGRGSTTAAAAKGGSSTLSLLLPLLLIVAALLVNFYFANQKKQE